MKTKVITAAILSAAMCLSVMTACGNTEKSEQSAQHDSTQNTQGSQDNTQDNKPEVSESESQTSKNETGSGENTTIKKLSIKDPQKHSEMTATFLNTASGASEDIKMEKSGEDDNCFIFTCEADAAKYNTVHLNYSGASSNNAAFSLFADGWYLKDDELYPCTAGVDPDYIESYVTKTFEYNGSDKNVLIWTPDSYDSNSEEKYSVLYMFDGQNVLKPQLDDSEEDDNIYNEKDTCWYAAESVLSMMSVTDNKAIIVAIESGEETRDDELVPAMGKPLEDLDTSRQEGGKYADFICETIMPYVQQSYNVYTDAGHTALAGSSLGGLETFYACLEHPDKFGTGGVFSPSFQVFSEEDIDKYLSGKAFDESYPFLYFYSGSFSQDTGKQSEMVYNKMTKLYPGNKLVYNKDENGEHTESYWRNTFPEFLEAMFTGRCSALECGAAVEYTDRTEMEEPGIMDFSFDADDTRPDEIRNYIFYDNSETKWDRVYAYWWDGMMPYNIVTNKQKYGNEWPGVEMERIEGTDIFRLEAPVGPANIIFDSGVTDEEVKAGKEAYQTVDMKYSTDMLGKIYKIDMSEKPSHGRGVEKTKYRYPAGSWSDYKP